MSSATGSPVLMGIDAGTTSVKAAIFDPSGQCVGIGREEYALSTPAPEMAELDAEIYWQSAIRAVRTALAKAQIHPGQVLAVTVSSQGETIIPVDHSGQPLYPAIVWLDNRPIEETAFLAQEFNDRLYAITGVPEVIPTWSACKILWLQHHQPEVFSRVHKYLLVQDFLIHRLSGEFITDGAVASTTLFYNIRTHTWWSEMLSAVGITEKKLPAIGKPGGIVGRLTPQAAQQLGLTTKTLVVEGGMDQCVGAIGSGSITPQVFSETTGAALAMQVSVIDPDFSAPHKLPLYMHSIPGLYLYLPYCPTGGMAFKWFRDTFAVEEITKAAAVGKDAYDLLTELAAQVPPGSDGLIMLPHLMGALSPENNMSFRGVFSGFTLAHSRAHFSRAVLEGVSFMLRRNIDIFRSAGIHPTEVRTSGGGARSPLWNQIKADICGIPFVTLATEEAGLLGNAILSGVAAGIFTSVPAGCQAMVTTQDRIYPSENSKVYNTAYLRYCQLMDALDPFFRSVM